MGGIPARAVCSCDVRRDVMCGDVIYAMRHLRMTRTVRSYPPLHCLSCAASGASERAECLRRIGWRSSHAGGVVRETMVPRRGLVFFLLYRNRYAGLVSLVQYEVLRTVHIRTDPAGALSSWMRAECVGRQGRVFLLCFLFSSVCREWDA